MNDYEMGVTHRFAAFCKKVLKLSAYKWHAKRKKHEEREISLSLVCEEYAMEFQDPKEYFEYAWHFKVQGMDVHIPNEQVAEAISHLKTKLQEVVLLYYFLDFNNEEIAELCQCNKRTIIRRKQEALGILEKELRDKHA